METELSTPNTRREREVWQACDDLWAQSASPRQLTGDNIRDQLLKLGYKRGSPNEIYRYRSSWKDSRGISDAHESQESEATASDPISRAVSLVYDQMRTQTSDAMDKLTADYEDRLKASLLEEEQLKTSHAELNAAKTVLERDLSLAQTRVNELERVLGEEKRSALLLNENLKGAKAQGELLASQHQALLVELKSFHEREIDLWRSQALEAKKMLEASKHEAKAERERDGAKFSDELMALKLQLRQTLEEKEQAKARCEVFEEQAKELKKQADLREVQGQDNAETLRWQRKIEHYLKQSMKSKRQETRPRR